MTITSIARLLGLATMLSIMAGAGSAKAQFYRDAYFEAECPDTASGNYRTRQTSIGGYAGSGYLRSAGNTTANVYNNTSADHAVYTFKVRHRGWISPWFRLNTNNSTADDSFFYRIDAGDWVTMNSIPSGSGWRWIKSSDAFLDEGNHTLEIANREDGLNVDKLAMMSTGATPTGAGGAAYNCPTSMYFETECRTSAWGRYVWDLKKKAGYSGQGYLEASSTSSDVNGSTDEVVYPFESGAGSYNLFFRIDTGGSGTSDSWFYRVDNGSWVTMNNTSGLGSGWRWAQGTAAVTLARGDHTLRIRNREAGLSLDKLAFIPTTAAAPSAAGGTGVNCEPFQTMADWDYFDTLAFADTHTNYWAATGVEMFNHHGAWHDLNGAGGTDGPGSGTAFLGFHRAMMNSLRQYAMENGGRSWLPVSLVGAATSSWLPDGLSVMDMFGRLIDYSPRELDIVDFQSPLYLTLSGTDAYNNRWRNSTVTIDGVTYAHLGDIPDLDTLGRAIAAENADKARVGEQPFFRDPFNQGDLFSYHGQFHRAVGGTMSSLQVAPADPIFYGWHGFIDRLVDTWLATPKGQQWAQAHSTHRFLQVGFTDHMGWDNTDPP